MLWRAPSVIVDPSTGQVEMADVRFAFENVLTWATMVVFALYLWFNVNRWFGLFLLLASFSAYYPINTSSSERAHGFIVYGLIWYTVCCKYLISNKAKEWMMNGICVICLFHIAFILLQGIFDYDPLMERARTLWTPMNYDPVPNVGLMSTLNGASVLLAICLPAFLRGRFSFIPIPVISFDRGGFKYFRMPVVGVRHTHLDWWCLTPLFIPAFIYTKTFIGPLTASVILACFFGAKYHIGFKRLALVFFSCIFFLFLYTTYVDKPDTNFRYKAWKASLTKHMPQRPWFGSGLGHWKLVYSRPSFVKMTADIEQKLWFAQAHNEVIQGQFEMGNLFSFILIGYLLNILRRYRNEAIIPFLALIAILMTSSTFFPFHIPFTAMISLIWLALLQKTLSSEYSCSSLSRFSALMRRKV